MRGEFLRKNILRSHTSEKRRVSLIVIVLFVELYRVYVPHLKAVYIDQRGEEKKFST